MENNTKPLELLIERVVDYGKTGCELIKLKTVNTCANVFSGVVPLLISLALACMFFLFISLGASLWIGEMLGKSYYGFVLVALFYLVLSLILYLTVFKYIKNRMRNRIIKLVLKN